MQVEIRAGFIMMYRKIISLQIYINLRKVAKREYLIITMRKCVLCKNMIAFPVKTQTSLSWFVWRENMKIVYSSVNTPSFWMNNARYIHPLNNKISVLRSSSPNLFLLLRT